MTRSIKFKFTAFFAVTIAVVVISFGLILLVSNNVQLQPIQPVALDDIALNRPGVRDFINRLESAQEIIEISQALRDRAINQMNSALLILIPAVILAGTAAAYFLASYLVEPIEVLANRVTGIGSKNLAERIPKEVSSTEVEILTDRINQLLDELEQAFKAQESFIGDAAHELRTPLAAMKTHLDVHKQSGKKPSVETIQVVERLNNQLIYLSEQLLYLNRSQSQKTSDPVEITGLLEDVVDAISPLAKDKEIEIKTAKLEKGTIRINPDDFVKIAKNLIENSIKYSDKNSTITLSVLKNSKFMTLKVEDTGSGIEEDDLPKIFDRFYRAADATAVAEGSGLGLSIVKKIVQAYGGKIEVSSKINEGTSFAISLPR